MNELIDLHVHTTASDGTMTPRDLVLYAASKGLKAVAVTDHDTVGGVAEALEAGKEAGLKVVPGVEISVDYPGEMHILGYFIDYKDPRLTEGLDRLRQFRENRNPLIVEKLRELGFDITMQEVINAAGGNIVGRPHFAAVMVRKGHVKDTKEAFENYLAAGKPAYVKKDRLTPREGIELITGAGGVPVLAHPKYLRFEEGRDLVNLIGELKELGLRGLEVYYSEHSTDETERFHRLAVVNDLIITGGTDFHGTNKADIEIGIGRGNLAVSYDLLDQFKKLQKFRKNTKKVQQ